MPENFGHASLVAGERLGVSSYCLQPGQEVSVRAYVGVETALCALEGVVLVMDWQSCVPLRRGEVMVVPAGTPFGMRSVGEADCVVLQTAAPRPWSADFQGPEPENAVLPRADTGEPEGSAGGDAAHPVPAVQQVYRRAGHG